MKIALIIASFILFGCQVKDERITPKQPESQDVAEENSSSTESTQWESIYGIWQNDPHDSTTTKHPTLYITKDADHSWIDSRIHHPLFDDSNKLYVGSAFYYGSSKQIEAYEYSVIQFEDKLYTCQLFDNLIDNSEVIDWSELIIADHGLKFNNYSSLNFTKVSNQELKNPFLEIISLFNRDNKYTNIVIPAPKNQDGK